MCRFLLLGAVCVGLVPSIGLAQPSPGDVVINEVMYAPSPSTNEFVELYNRSAEPVELSQLSFADTQQDYTAVSPVDSKLAPEDYVVLVRDPDAFEAAFPSVNPLAPPGWDALNNGGDTVYLRHSSSNTVLDSVPYTPSWGGRNGHSLERIDPGGASDRAENFTSSEATASATPGTQNSVYAPDETPPTLNRVIPSRKGDALIARFSEPLDVSTVTTANVHLEGTDTPAVVDAAVGDSTFREVQYVLETTLAVGSYTLVATNVGDRQGNVRPKATAAFSYFEATPPLPEDIVISEILYAPSEASNEFIELYNLSDETFDLGALQVADEQRDFHAVAPPFTPFEPGTYVVLVRDSEAFETSYPDTEHLAPDGWAALNNGGDTPLIRHAPTATPLDSVPYAASWGGTPGASLERIDPKGPSDAPSNFAASTAPTGATPGAQNTRHAPDTTAPSPVFAEQVGPTDGTVRFDEPIEPTSVHAEAFRLGSTPVVDVHLQEDRVVHLAFSSAPTTSSLSVTGVRDRVGNAMDEASLPFAHRPAPGTLIVNELLFDPRADDFDERPNQVEYVELVSRSDRPISLNDLLLTDRPTEQGHADTLRVGLPRAVPPGGFAVVTAAPTGATETDSLQLVDAFPDAPLLSDTVSVLPVHASRLGLDNAGDLVRVQRADGTAIAEVAFDPSWHASGLAETKGTALERISPTAQGPQSDNWTSSPTPAGGTPGAPNAVGTGASSTGPAAPGLTVEPSPFSIERDGATRIQYRLSDVPNLIRVRIYDSRGRKVRTLEEARLTGRTGELVWNGRNDAGNRVRIGIYVVLFEAVRSDAGTVRRFKEPVVVARPLN